MEKQKKNTQNSRNILKTQGKYSKLKENTQNSRQKLKFFGIFEILLCEKEGQRRSLMYYVVYMHAWTLTFFKRISFLFVLHFYAFFSISAKGLTAAI